MFYLRYDTAREPGNIGESLHHPPPPGRTAAVGGVNFFLNRPGIASLLPIFLPFSDGMDDRGVAIVWHSKIYYAGSETMRTYSMYFFSLVPVVP